MKKSVLYLVIVTAGMILASCGGGAQGNLIGVQGRPQYFQQTPYGMLFIPQGSYHMGQSDQDAPHALTSQAKVVTVQSFYMDETEITNNEYRQFVYYVRDSIARRILGENGFEDDYFMSLNEYDEDIDPPVLIWKRRIPWDGEEEREYLVEMYLPEHERYYRRKQFDTRKFLFEYYWIDLRTAAKRSSREQGKKDRSVFIKKDIIPVYPDTLAWIHDFTYSFHEPMTNMYFWHPAYDHYPVVGVNWKQARAFSIWRTQLLNSYYMSIGEPFVQDFRLPTESEWEYAARGGLEHSPYPWGGPYIRNYNGCFLGNYKPLRGNYQDDGGVQTLIVAHFAPNDFGLYDMAGNVAEWTSNAFDESAYSYTHDLNADYVYEADDDNDPPALKRKVIRGGSWKDIGFYMQTGTRTYEYQDTAKCYIGFRNVMTYLGRHQDDDPANASNVY